MFPLGQTVMTPGAQEIMERLDPDGNVQRYASGLLDRHVSGDWGDVDEQDRGTNENALKHDGRLMSVYGTDFATKLYVITEADRSVTTILTPRDY
ncbi:hypothetical protein [Candidatus Solirubrobacter pratensis]|uniref:hypothetical protein n=1 Tax=Candidatus Solirubrobacter pratensis TaxID=1298857 RepID=UPI000563EE60|nr:hypothetical protein [Candidatus Solirubrobacter pratensis]